MSKDTPTKKRKTRLKGTETKKPCKVVKRDGTVLGCLKTKDRFKDFKPRWSGCDTHRTPQGRRFYQQGCDACEAKVNGNIRQPFCIECDASRPKKRNGKKKAADPKPTVAAEIVEKVQAGIDAGDKVISIKVESEAEKAERYAASSQRVLATVETVVEAEPESQTLGTFGAGADSDDPAELAQHEADLESEPVIEAQAEPSPESEDVTPEPAPIRPVIANMADFSKLFSAEGEDDNA